MRISSHGLMQCYRRRADGTPSCTRNSERKPCQDLLICLIQRMRRSDVDQTTPPTPSATIRAARSHRPPPRIRRWGRPQTPHLQRRRRARRSSAVVLALACRAAAPEFSHRSSALGHWLGHALVWVSVGVDAVKLPVVNGQSRRKRRRRTGGASELGERGPCRAVEAVVEQILVGVAAADHAVRAILETCG